MKINKTNYWKETVNYHFYNTAQSILKNIPKSLKSDAAVCAGCALTPCCSCCVDTGSCFFDTDNE